ncbi:MAG TPA: adenosylcobinamide-GDP ribazoletransferase [Candidatus Dormibacteraeota bacterium]
MPAPDHRPTPLAGARAAVAFLTLVPVARVDEVGPADVGRGTIYFPLVGAGVGGVAALVAWAVAHVLPPTIAALAAVAVGAVLTGALHLDGLADTADGYGGRTRARVLEIMRDHSVGSFGVVAVVLDVGLRTAAVTALMARPHGLLLLVAAGALSRSAAAGLGILLPDARGGGGQAAVLGGVAPWRAAVAVAVGVVVAGLCAGWAGGVAAVGVGAAAVLWAWHCMRRLGGMTGDTLGAASEAGELVVLLTGAALR